MGLNVNIEDGGGSERQAKVDKNNALVTSVVESDVPPIGEPNRFQYFTSLLSVDGAVRPNINSLTDMNVDGSTTSQTFFLQSQEEFDIHIMTLIIVIADNAVVHNNFGNISALSNGWDLAIIESGEEQKIIDAAQTGGQVLLQTGMFAPYGNGATVNELVNHTGGTDAQTIQLPLWQLVPGGLRLGRGTQDRIVSTINDDLTGLNEFTVRCLGYKHIPSETEE